MKVTLQRERKLEKNPWEQGLFAFPCQNVLQLSSGISITCIINCSLHHPWETGGNVTVFTFPLRQLKSLRLMQFAQGQCQYRCWVKLKTGGPRSHIQSLTIRFFPIMLQASGRMNMGSRGRQTWVWIPTQPNHHSSEHAIQYWLSKLLLPHVGHDTTPPSGLCEL